MFKDNEILSTVAALTPPYDCVLYNIVMDPLDYWTIPGTMNPGTIPENNIGCTDQQAGLYHNGQDPFRLHSLIFTKLSLSKAIKYNGTKNKV